MTLENLVSRIQGNKYIKIIALTAIVLGAFITIGTFFSNIRGYLYDNIFISKNISDKVSNLYAGQSINFFKQTLGEEKLQRNVSQKYTEYIFQYKSSFIQVLTNKADNEVIYWAITYCGDNPVYIKRKIFSLNEIGVSNNIKLNESNFSDVFSSGGDFRYFISGATANSFAYESLYLGNPGAYQTFIIGVNDICKSSSFEYLDVSNSSSKEQIRQFRETNKINTYGETAPFVGEEIIKLLNSQETGDDPYITFGVDRIRVRYFNY